MSKIDELPLSDTQRQQLTAMLTNGNVGHTAIASTLTKWGYPLSEMSVRRYRRRIGVTTAKIDNADALGVKVVDWESANVVVTSQGGTLSTGALDEPLDLSTDWDEVMRGFGLDPAVFQVQGDTVSMSKWQQSRRLDNGDRDIVWLYSYKASFTRRSAEADEFDVAALRKRVHQWKPKAPARNASDDTPSTFVICWADWQLAKSAGGGVKATIARIEESYQLCVDRIAELRKMGRNVDKVAILNMGDPIEGCDGNYASQLHSVELNQREQLNLCLDLWANGILAIEPDVFASVLCNHGEWTRRGPGTKPVTTDSDNVGGYLGDTLQRVFDGREGAPSEWSIPHDEMVTMLDLSGLKVAITHGHKIPSAAKEADWLRAQSIRLLREHGAEPRLWVTAHKHHVRVDDFGPWWRLQCPSLDGGSKYYTDMSGNWSTPGTLTFLAGRHDARGWSDLAILGSGE